MSNAIPETIEQAAPAPIRLHSVVGASDQRLYTFFIKDESIHEIEAADAEAALQKMGDKLGKPSWLYRYWLLQDIETCLTPENNLTGRTQSRNDHLETGGRDASEDESGASVRCSNAKLCGLRGDEKGTE
jgi:hypothetical protein